jgi:rare lipoprotein A
MVHFCRLIGSLSVLEWTYECVQSAPHSHSVHSSHCASKHNPSQEPKQPAPRKLRIGEGEVGATAVGSAEVGVASFYAHKYHGRKTASGEKYNMHEMTAAHRRLPFGAKVRVTNLSNNSSVVVRVNDRGPFVKGRVIDLSLAAAKKLDMVRTGLAKVEVVPVSGGVKRVAAVP